MVSVIASLSFHLGDYFIGIIIDYVDPDLTKFNMELVDLYMDIPFVQTQCGYACSDQ